MKTLFIFKSRPDDIQNQIMDKLKSEHPDYTTFELYKDNVDWDLLIDLIFEHKKVISWW
jgi:hypothetical protein